MKKSSGYVLITIAIFFTGILLGAYIGRGSNTYFFTAAGSISTAVQADTPSTVPETHVGKININTATAEQLILLPGIGEVLAQRIIQDRQENGPFQCVEDLVRVKGIGENSFNALKDYIIVGE